MDKFIFEMGDTVKIACSAETGVVIGRAEFAASEPQYFIHYQTADGRAVNAWWDQSLLASTNH